jgi:hypothetical protein
MHVEINGTWIRGFLDDFNDLSDPHTAYQSSFPKELRKKDIAQAKWNKTCSKRKRETN